MPESIERATFVPCLHQAFTLETEDGPVALELVEVEALSEATRAPEGREPFSLIFLGPKGLQIEQSIYTLTHREIGDIELFLVPLGPDLENQGLRFEAVFT